MTKIPHTLLCTCKYCKYQSTLANNSFFWVEEKKRGINMVHLKCSDKNGI